MDELDLYEILNVDRSSTKDDIKSQYKRLAKTYHPDKNNGDDSNFKKISYAYDILQNESTRNEYDKKKYINEDVVKQFFTDITNIGVQKKIIIKVNDIEILYGCYKTYTIDNDEMCTHCNGTGINDYKKNVIICRECKGNGTINIFSSNLPCNSCFGKGNFILNNINCKICNGTKKISNPITNKIYIKPGIKNNKTIEISPQVLIIVEHSIDNNHIFFNNNDVHLNVSITCNELLCGFQKNIKFGHENICLKSDHIFDFQKDFVKEGKGIMNSGNLVIHFKLDLENVDTRIYSKISKALRNILHISFDSFQDNSAEIIHIN
tara:strand:+ start:4307 stop:5269 length:963 start_codon:yes stop_codon:yes gene_type:complete